MLLYNCPVSMEKQSPEKKSQSIKMALLAGALVAAPHEPARALDLDPKQSWATEISGKIRESEQKDRDEHMVVYVKFSPQSGQWLPLKMVGDVGSVRADDKLQTIKQTIADNPRAKEVKEICIGHTHPTHSFRQMFKDQDKASRIASPPSFQDLFNTVMLTKRFVGNEKPKVAFKYFVVDTQGVWSFSMEDPNIVKPGQKPLDNQALAQGVMQFREASADFQIRSLNGGDVVGSKEYAALQASAKTFGAKVKLTPYAHVPKTNPCE